METKRPSNKWQQPSIVAEGKTRACNSSKTSAIGNWKYVVGWNTSQQSAPAAYGTSDASWTVYIGLNCLQETVFAIVWLHIDWYFWYGSGGCDSIQYKHVFSFFSGLPYPVHVPKRRSKINTSENRRMRPADIFDIQRCANDDTHIHISALSPSLHVAASKWNGGDVLICNTFCSLALTSA